MSEGIRKFRLLIEGWRDLPHSYSVVNQFQCLELLKRAEVELRHRDMPYYFPQWRAAQGLFEPAKEAMLRAIPKPEAGETFDAVLRMDVPYRVDRAPEGRTFVFITAEYGRVLNLAVAGGRSLRQASRADVVYVTSSHWSLRGLQASGVGDARVEVVPPGIDPAFFKPLTDPAKRAELRARLGLSGFVFAHFGVMTANKQVPLLLKAFGTVAGRHPEARLLLKGLDAINNSRQMLMNSAGLLTAEEIQVVQPRLVYIGNTLSFAQMGELYQAVDAYVSPYEAEAFNMPVLEAAACGLPVICTAGGPTEDFTHPDFALKIAATEKRITMVDGGEGILLAASLESLIEQMRAVVEVPEIVRRAREAGPRFVGQGFYWSQVVERLLGVLRDSAMA